MMIVMIGVVNVNVIVVILSAVCPVHLDHLSECYVFLILATICLIKLAQLIVVVTIYLIY